MNIAQIRKQYPEYNDMSDQALADALHAKFYPDMPKAQFYQKIGLNNSYGGALKQAAQNLGHGLYQSASDIGNALTQDIVHYSPLRLLPSMRNLASNSKNALADVQKNYGKVGSGALNNIAFYGGRVAPYIATAAIPGAQEEDIAGAVSKLGFKPNGLASGIAKTGVKSAELGAQGAALNPEHPLQGFALGAISPAAVDAPLAILGKVAKGIKNIPNSLVSKTGLYNFLQNSLDHLTEDTNPEINNDLYKLKEQEYLHQRDNVAKPLLNAVKEKASQIKARFNPNNYNSAVKDLASIIKNARTATNSDVEKANDILPDLNYKISGNSGSSFADAVKYREGLNDIIGRHIHNWRDPDSYQILQKEKKKKKALDTDTSESAAQTGNEDFIKLERQARKEYQKKVNLETQNGKATPFWRVFTGKASPEKFVDQYVKPNSGASDYSARLEDISGITPPGFKKQLGASYLNLNRGDTRGMLTSLGKLNDKQIEELFQEKAPLAKQLVKIDRAIRNNRRAPGYLRNSLGRLGLSIFGGEELHSHPAIGSAMLALGIGGGKVGNALLDNQRFRNQYLRYLAEKGEPVATSAKAQISKNALKKLIFANNMQSESLGK